MGLAVGCGAWIGAGHSARGGAGCDVASSAGCGVGPAVPSRVSRAAYPSVSWCPSVQHSLPKPVMPSAALHPSECLPPLLDVHTSDPAFLNMPGPQASNGTGVGSSTATPSAPLPLATHSSATIASSRLCLSILPRAVCRRFCSFFFHRRRSATSAGLAPRRVECCRSRCSATPAAAAPASPAGALPPRPYTGLGRVSAPIAGLSQSPASVRWLVVPQLALPPARAGVSRCRTACAHRNLLLVTGLPAVGERCRGGALGAGRAAGLRAGRRCAVPLFCCCLACGCTRRSVVPVAPRSGPGTVFHRARAPFTGRSAGAPVKRRSRTQHSTWAQPSTAARTCPSRCSPTRTRS
jgi:hypothetical protein